jgi:hypothetical protein
MVKKDKLTQVSERIGTAMGKADKKARQFKKAGVIAKAELRVISKHIDELKKRLEKTTKRLHKALR